MADHKSLNVLINGAGVAGTCLAALLVRQGHAVTVVERWPELRTTGLQIDLRSHGIEIIRKMGLDDKFRARAAKEDGFEFVNAKGKRWAFFPANRAAEAAGGGRSGADGKSSNKKKQLQSFTSDYEIMRGDLCRLLHDAAEEAASKSAAGSVQWRFGSEVVGLSEMVGDDGRKAVIATIKHNPGGSSDKTKTTQETFDLVVGADGVGSKVRRLMTENERASSRSLSINEDPAFLPYSGDYSGYFTMKRTVPKNDSVAVAHFWPGSSIMIRGDKDGDRDMVYLGCTSRSGDSPLLKAHTERDVAGQKAALAEIFKDSSFHRLGEVLQGLRDSDDFYLERLGVVRCERWTSISSQGSRGRVALIGDAGYCPSAKTGMGTTSAVMGAWILAGEIGQAARGSSGKAPATTGAEENAKLDAALEAYERKFRPAMNQVQRGLPETPTWYDGLLETRVGIAFMYWFLAAAAFFGIDVLSMVVIQEEIKDWELPSYSL
ncbi:uncharacterized protein B0I36DRAFT_361150 [Microdochium trichocladiopsis]|uniref:FAD-binding domain-containing protein n=1 Tax=Microdochium trichocladiopsis TaxID=1682393 RepID=A0A9P8YA18_9PEZI|nr:uncharacterized protein B0I36DRAFT_361150 [Microdochium trichocladiopsis]KAH7035824.1 hypothetical protein B0I36DRAFT_361150 [Microdochium trichocladiopsis]